MHTLDILQYQSCWSPQKVVSVVLVTRKSCISRVGHMIKTTSFALVNTLYVGG